MWTEEVCFFSHWSLQSAQWSAEIWRPLCLCLWSSVTETFSYTDSTSGASLTWHACLAYYYLFVRSSGEGLFQWWGLVLDGEGILGPGYLFLPNIPLLSLFQISYLDSLVYQEKYLSYPDCLVYLDFVFWYLSRRETGHGDLKFVTGQSSTKVSSFCILAEAISGITRIRCPRWRIPWKFIWLYSRNPWSGCLR